MAYRYPNHAQGSPYDSLHPHNTVQQSQYSVLPSFASASKPNRSAMLPPFGGSTGNSPSSQSPHHVDFSPTSRIRRSAEAGYPGEDSPASRSSDKRSTGKRKVSESYEREGSASVAGNDEETRSNGSGQVEKPRRKKKAVSCESCRRRKLKCDRGWPCGACRDRSEAHLCKWEGGTKPQVTGRDADNAPLLVRMGKIEEMLSLIAGRVGIPTTEDTAFSSEKISPSESAMQTQSTQRPALRDVEGNCKADIGRGGTCSHNMTMLSMSCQPITSEQARSELMHVVRLLPDLSTTRKLCKRYFDEVDLLHYTVDQDDFWRNGIAGVEELLVIAREGRSRIGPDIKLKSHLQLLSLVLTMCGLCLLFNDREEFVDVVKQTSSSPPYLSFLDGGQRALNASDPFEEPTLMSIRTLILQVWAVAAVRGPAVGIALLGQATHLMFALDLDREPSETLPAAERRDRLRLFHCLAVIDWFSTGGLKRSYIIREEPNKHPYMFGPRSLKERIALPDSPFDDHQWRKLDLARLNRRGADCDAMTEEEAYRTTVEIQGELDEFIVQLPSHYDFDKADVIDSTKPLTFHRLSMMVGIAMQLISLHKRYYIRGWLDPTYRTSREICFISARKVCGLFRKVFGAVVPIDELMKMDVADAQASLANRQKFVSRLWFMAHASVGTCVLLQHHYAMMEMYPDVAGPNREQVKSEIVEDLRITKRLLLAISSYSQIAREGVAMLASAENHKQMQVNAASNDISARKDDRSEKEEAAARARRAKLAMDLQSITDINPILSTREENEKYHILHGAQRSRNNHSTPRSAANRNDERRMVPDSIRSNPDHTFSPNNSNKHANNTGIGGSSRAQGNNSSSLGAQGLAEMEALLSTDWYTGLPLAPEVSFQQQWDRFGGSQPYLPSGVVLGPTSPNFGLNSSNSLEQNQPDSISSGTVGTLLNSSSQPVAVAANPQGDWF